MKNDPEQLLIWGFGNHEPLDMYRRGGVLSGGIPGGARWLKEWHNFFDSDESVAQLEHLGVNIVHCRFYKGMGWEHEKEDFPAVRAFAERCRKRGIKVLGYVQYSSLYWEILGREIPDLRDWAIVDEHGEPRVYGGTQYWRHLPCPSNPRFFEYTCGILQKALDAGCFDGAFDRAEGLAARKNGVRDVLEHRCVPVGPHAGLFSGEGAFNFGLAPAFRQTNWNVEVRRAPRLDDAASGEGKLV